MKVAEALALRSDAQKRLAQVQARANSTSELEPGLTVTDAIARRDELARRRTFVTAVAAAAAGEAKVPRQLRSELRYVTNVPVANLRREADDLARQYRELDTRIQEANWRIELLD